MIAPGLLAALAFAEPKPVDPYMAYVSAEKAPLVCMPNDSAYTLAEVKSGMVVRVDADDARWARIEYPQGLPAFVRASDVSIEGDQAKLTHASKLFALNQTKGGIGSWKAVFDVELPVGTVLKLADTTPEKQGEQVIGYRVIAPTGAKAFVDAKALRRATPAEVDAAKAAGASLGGVAVAPSTGSVTPPGAGEGVKPVASKTPTTPKTDTTAPKTSTEEAIKAAAGAPASDVKASGAQPEERRIASVDQLEASFIEVRKQPVLTAEFTELMAEYQRAIAAVPADKSHLKRQLQQRLDYLQLQKDIQESVRSVEATRAQADEQMQKGIRDAIAQIEKTRVYTIVGTLQASTVYDGVRLPRMFRVQSVGDATPRTLGYITPQAELKLEEKVGLVVGIIGKAQLDQSLHLNVIEPVRVDVLRAGETGVPQPAATPEAKTDGPAVIPATPIEPKDQFPEPKPEKAPEPKSEPKPEPKADPALTPVPPAPGPNK